MLESEFQKQLVKKIKKRYEGCIVIKTDPVSHQGIPDLLILFNNHWACLECKRNVLAQHQPNQEYYVQKTDTMSFARFISPETEAYVLDELDSFFKGE